MIWACSGEVFGQDDPALGIKRQRLRRGEQHSDVLVLVRELIESILPRGHLLHPLDAARVERLILERGEDDDAGKALVCYSSAKGRRH